MSACTSAKLLATPTPVRSAFLALRSRFMSGNKRFAASSATTSAKVFASMWWKSVLFCMIAVGSTSSKCDLTFVTSVKPLRTSINWERIDHKSPFGPCSNSPVYNTFHHIIRIYRNLDVRLFVGSAGDLDGSPKLGSWNRLSAWRMASQETDALQPETCVTENLHRESGLSKCDLSQSFGSVTAASRSVRGYQQIVVGTLIETTAFPRVLASVHSASSFAGNQSRGNKPWANKT